MNGRFPSKTLFSVIELTCVLNVVADRIMVMLMCVCEKDKIMES